MTDPIRISDDQHNNAPAVPQGWKLAPVWLLERVERSLGSFTSDEGWAQSDMDTMDSVSALLAATPAPAPAPAQEPETALQKFTRFKVAETEGNPVEMLRAFCAFAMNSQDWFDVEPFFDLVREAMASRTAVAPAQEVATLSLAAEDVHAAFTKNFPKSRISQAWINFAADIAQAIAARAAKPAQEVRLTDEAQATPIPCAVTVGATVFEAGTPFCDVVDKALTDIEKARSLLAQAADKLDDSGDTSNAALLKAIDNFLDK